MFVALTVLVATPSSYWLTVMTSQCIQTRPDQSVNHKIVHIPLQGDFIQQ